MIPVVRKVTICAAVAVVGALLAGCSEAEARDQGSSTGRSQVDVHVVTLPSGRHVTCIWEQVQGGSSGSPAGGLSCDWTRVGVREGGS